MATTIDMNELMQKLAELEAKQRNDYIIRIMDQMYPAPTPYPKSPSYPASPPYPESALYPKSPST
jgi:hypothetical protein